MRFSQHSILGALLTSAAFSAAAPTESAAARHATVVTRQALLSNYTFIIAGGGIAGLTLADRLTEDPNGKSGLFRAGLPRGDDILLTHHSLFK
jgi:hypothetical protein